MLDLQMWIGQHPVHRSDQTAPLHAVAIAENPPHLHQGNSGHVARIVRRERTQKSTRERLLWIIVVHEMTDEYVRVDSPHRT